MANKSQKQMLFDSIVNSQIDDAYKAKVEANYNAWAQQQASMPQIDNDYQAKVDADYNAWANSQKKASTASVQPKQIQSASMPAIMNRVEPTMENLKLASERQGVWQNDYNPITVHQDKPKSDFAGTSFENGILKMYGNQPTVTQENINELNKFKQIPNLKDYLTAINEQTSGNNIADIQQTVANVAQAEKWLDPEYKLSKEEEKQAKELANTELAKLKGHALTEDEKQRKQTYEDLKSKTSDLHSFGINARDALYKFGKGMTDLAVRIGTPQLQAKERERNAMRAAIGQAPVLSSEDINAMSNAVTQFENDVNNWEIESGYRDLVRNTKTQNPIASGAGSFAGNAAVYGLTGGATGLLGETLGIGGTVGGYLANQGIQASQDLVSDIWPTVIEMREDGELTPEEYKALEQQFSTDVIGNVFMDVAGNAVGELARNAISKVAAKRAAQAAEQAAFTQNIKQGADYLEYLNKTGATGLEPKATDIPQIDPTTANNNNFRTLMDEFNHTFKDDSAMKNIFTPEDLEAAQKAQFDELMKDRPKTIKDLAPEEIPEINNIKPSLLDEIDAMNGEMENMFTTPKEAKTEPILPQIEQPKTIRPYVDLPAETKEMAVSDFLDMFRMLDDMEKAADATGNPTAREKFDRLNKAMSDYETAVFKSEDMAEVNKAKKATDAARQSFIREMKKIDPNYKAELTGTRIGNAEYRRSSLKGDEQAAQEWADSVIEAEKELNNNRFVRDAEPDNVIPFRGVEDNAKQMNLQMFGENESGIDPALKVSDTYNNTGKRGGGWTADEIDKHTKAHNFLYETIDEQRSVEEATRMRAEEGREAFKNRVLYEDRISSIELDGLMMEWRELTEEARALEAQGKRADIKWQEANKIFRKVQEQSTDNAQALQALAKWSRNTAEGMLVNAENIINGKVGPEKTAMQKALDKYLKSKKIKVEFSPEFERDFLNEAKKVEGLTGNALDTRAAQKTMAKLGKMVNDQIPVKLPEKLQTFLMDNMLGNFRTLISRNAGGNVGLNAMEQTIERPLAAGIDKLVSLKTGKRTQAGLSIEGLSDYFSGFKKGLADELSDVKTGLHTARSGENTLGNAITSNRRIFKSKLLNLNDQLVRHGLSVGDRPFYESVYKQTLGDYQRLYDKGLMGDQVQSLKPEEFKQYAEVAANLNALGAVYQQNSQLSNGLLGLKRGVGQISDGILGFDILSQFSMPFVKTPANVVERAIDYSPLGFVRNTARTAKELNNGAFDQNRFANETARNIIGTGLMTGGAVLSANGGLTDAYSDDKDKKQAQKESGMQEYAWNVPEAIPGIGGKQMDISWVPVLGSNLVAAAAAENAYKNGGEDLGLNLYKGAMAGGQALFDQSMFQGLQRLFGTGDSFNSDQGIVENMGNTVKSGLGQFIPSLARQSAQVIDPYQRDLAYSNKGESFGPMNNYDINSLANNIPFLRQDYLAPKVDTEGNLMKENQGRNVGMKILEDMILPGKLTEYNENSLTKESNRLTDVTGNNTSYLPKADRSKVDPENNMSNDAWVDYQQKYYKQMNGAASTLIASDYYKGLSDADKEQALSNLYKDVKSVINAEYTGKDISSGGKVFKEQGIDGLIKSYEAKAINKQYGLSSSSSVAKDIQKAVNSGDTQKAEQIAQTLADFKDYGSDNATNAYKRYEKTKSYIPGLTVSEYKKTLKEIDGLGDQGKVNGQISQKEMLAYLNQNNISDEEAQKLFKEYGNDWKGTLKRKKDGTWTVSNK